jgi:hypothetical protein
MVIEDVVLRGELICLMSNQWLLEFQIAWGIIVLSTKNHFLYIQIVIQNLEFLEMSEISSQFTFEQLGPSKLMENLEDKTYPLVRRWPQGTANHIVVDWRGGA